MQGPATWNSLAVGVPQRVRPWGPDTTVTPFARERKGAIQRKPCFLPREHRGVWLRKGTISYMFTHIENPMLGKWHQILDTKGTKCWERDAETERGNREWTHSKIEFIGDKVRDSICSGIDGVTTWQRPFDFPLKWLVFMLFFILTCPSVSVLIETKQSLLQSLI